MADRSTPQLTPIHDFGRKLRQPGVCDALNAYVQWQRQARSGEKNGNDAPPLPVRAPVSINLDLTTACNYACDHCIDWDILNSGINHRDEELRASIAAMHRDGLRSVILIGGGEPTIYPGFASMVRYLKSLSLQVAIVSNGSRNDRIAEVMDILEAEDWVRLSLDSGTDETFQAMHRPKKAITLEAICKGVSKLKAKNPVPTIGFSFVMTWNGAMRAPDAPAVVENIGEIESAARLARDHGFDYISFKPFLLRTDEGAEVLDPHGAKEALDEVVQRIRTAIDGAKQFASPTFCVLESTNWKVLEQGTWEAWTKQPKQCHMQAFRQVLSPEGLWNCPAHRGVDGAKIAERTIHTQDDTGAIAARHTQAMIESFDARHECREVTCLYHDVNWWIESLIENAGPVSPSPSKTPAPSKTPDFFL